MSERTVNPELFHLSAALLNWDEIVRVRGGDPGLTGGPASLTHGDTRIETLQLRWMVAPSIGLPRKPFTVYYRRDFVLVEQLPNTFGYISGVQRLDFPELMGILQFDFNLTAPGAFVLAFSQNGALLTASSAQNATGPVTLTVQNSGIAYVLLIATGDLLTIYGLPSLTIVNSAGWVPVETVGLPVDPHIFAGSGYSVTNQGFVTAPIAPVDAAKRRLNDGAPLLGWPNAIAAGVLAPPWVPPAIDLLIDDLQQNVLGDILHMLNMSTGQFADVSVTLQKTIQAPAQAGGGMPAPLGQPSQATYAPLSILLLAAGCDPFNALGLGFGTAYTMAILEHILSSAPLTEPPGKRRSRRLQFFGIMVTAEYNGSLLGVTIAGEMADFVTTNFQLGLTPAPTNVTAEVTVLNPPLVCDQPYTGTLQATWDRPDALFPTQTVAASYAVARSSPTEAATLLNATRVRGGFMPYAASLAPTDDATAPIVFEDVHVTPPSSGDSVTYSIAAQDWFGVWSAWSSATASFPPEPLIGPAVTDAQLALTESTAAPYTATLTAQIAYNWTTRSPQQIDILVGLFRPSDQVTPLPTEMAPSGIQYSVAGPMSPPVSMTFDAAGSPSVTGGPGVTATQLPAPSYATPQQDIRVYSVVIPGFSLDFAGANEIVAFVFATGYEVVNPIPVTTTNPRIAHVMSPAPPPLPQHDAIVWASLPDQRGISRVHLAWDPNGAPAGTAFLIYTATETGLLGAAGAPAADLTASYASRLAVLRGLDFSQCRSTFRRLSTIPSRLTDPSQEIELPRGTRVLHAFVITAISPNNIETPFPTDASAFIAVAVPYVETPRAPRIFTRLVPNGGSAKAEIHVESRKGVTPDRFLLYRTQREGLARDLDLIGPPISNSDQSGWTKTPVDLTDGTWTAIYTDPTPLGTMNPWERVWYRAVAVTDDRLTDGAGNPQGALGGRSPSSSAATIIVPPPAPPPLTALSIGAIDHVDMTVLVSFQTSAPIAATALGSHTLTVTVVDTQQPSASAAATWRTAIALDLIQRASAFPASGSAGSSARLPTSGGSAIGIWVPRPTRTNGSTADFIVTVSVTDPIGRSSQLSTTVGWWT